MNPGPMEPGHGTPDTGSTTSDFTEWRRVHPLTPALKSWLFILAAIGVLLAQSQQFLQELVTGGFTGSDGILAWLLDHPLVILAILGGLILLLALIGFLNWLVWRRTGYHIDDEAIYLRKGLLNRQLRTARLDRVQAIDINQPLVPRLFGLAKLRFDVAGGKDSSVDLEFLGRDRAEELREALLDRVRALRAAEDSHRAGDPAGGSGSAPGAGHGPAGTLPDSAGDTGAGSGAPGSGPGSHPGGAVGRADGPAGGRGRASAASAPGANLGSRLMARIEPTAAGVIGDIGGTLTDVLRPYTVRARADDDGRILRIPAHTVLLSGLLSTGTLVTLAFVLAVLAGFVVLAVIGRWEAITGSIVAIIPLFAAAYGVVKKSFDESNFSVTITRDGLAVTHGLTTTTRRIIPLDRIQAVRLSQPLLWRYPDWWRAEYTIAGQEGENTSTTLLPVGSLDQCLMMLGLVLPHPQVPGGLSGRELMVEAMYAGPAPGADAEPSDAEPSDAGGPGAGGPGADSPDAGGPGVEPLFHHQDRASRWLDPLTYRRNGWVRTGSMLVIRSGRLDRRVDCVPHARVQSMRVFAGPIQRALGLASVDLHSTAGPVKPQVSHQTAATAEEFFFEHAEITRQARAALDAHTGGPDVMEPHSGGPDPVEPHSGGPDPVEHGPLR
ncbi:PH domain-containing protein [Brevibacterium pityocampae]|uniref:YdbS-like PH domain-containing protein n=1 Tax=Brevibacterium pityocampae TaxID=506594 RepID=A0ABP8J6H9_9MICO